MSIIRKTYANILLLSAVFLLSTATMYSQEISRADYQRAESFLWENINNKQVFNLRLQSDFFPDSTGMWYIDYGPEQKDFYWVDFPDMDRRPLFDQQKLADALSTVLKNEVTANALPFDRVIYLNKDSLEIPVRDDRYVLDLNTYQIAKREREARNGPRTESTSPDGKWVAYTKDYNLFVRSTETGAIHQLSEDGEKLYEYGTYYGWGDLIEGENGERPAHFRVDWSPDSRWLNANICDLRSAEKMYLLDWSVDTLYKPRLLSYYRGSPGDSTIVTMIPLFYDMTDLEKPAVRLPGRGYIADYSIRVIEGSDAILVVDRDRGYKKMDILKFDLATGKQELLLTESSETNVENPALQVIPKSGQFLFLSERTGWQQLYLFDMKTGKIRALTQGDFVVHQTVRTDEKNGWVYFLASGTQSSDNPYSQYLYRVSLKGGNMQLLTPETGNHSIDLSPDGRYFVDEYSTYDKEAVFYLRDAANGKVLLELTRSDASALAAKGWSPAQAFTAVARDGKTTIYGVVWKPTNFDPNKKYPIIDNSYTGPHTQVFPRRFEQNFYSGIQDLAELGFVIVRIDGMGTAGRSKAFHDVSYKNMGQNLLDHVLAIRQLGERYSWADTSRVGIFGHSAGGYDAGHAVLAFPDFYKVAVASSADHDFRMEKAWWPEMYMGWPVDSSYHLASNITMAGNLKGKLLITHGGIDENVNPSATFKLAEALIKADKEFDMLILPSQHHGYGGQHSVYFRKKRWNYFVEHLLGAKPIWEGIR
jgi:dipeptidyl aminopeptidase/acylaminoacyl peptidase